MLAAWYEVNGSAGNVIRIGDLSAHEPGYGEVRVKLHASGVNPSDVKSRAARPVPDGFCIPHSDGAGIIDAVGDGVSPDRVGQRVWVWNGQWQRSWGTAAEYITLPELQAVPLPDNTSFEEGACLGIPALTAFRAVELLGSIAGKTVVVIGAGSSVGHYVTQMAVLGGATVIGTAGSPERIALAKASGAAYVVNYKTEPVVERIKELTGGRGADGLIDMDFSSTAALLGQGIVAPHSTVVSYGTNTAADIPVPFRSLLFASLTLQLFLVYDLTPPVRQHAITRLNEWLAAGKLKHVIGARFPLAETAKAHEAVESGKVVGSVVVTA
ncbi:MAG: NADPH:quinone reductase [Burkholderiaceae bacterium]